MADEQQADPDKSLKTTAPAPAAPQGDDWGADWESAFQAEEFHVDEAEGDAVLAEGGSGGVNDFVSAEEESLDELSPGAGEAGPAGAVGAAAPTVALPAGPGLSARLITRFLALPMPVRFGIPAALLLLLIGITVFRLIGRPVQPLPPVPEQVVPVATLAPAVTPPDTAAAPATAVPSADATPPADTGSPQTEKITITWPFTAFIISVVDEESKATLFVNVELSMVLALDDEKQGLPLSQKPFVRDTIYQFFVNRPIYDLRRYAMAKGEMSDQLIEWLRKQWPEGKVASLAIDSYTIN